MLWAQTSPAPDADIISELRSGNYIEAKQLIDQALVSSANDARLWTLDGYALLHLGSEKNALAA